MGRTNRMGWYENLVSAETRTIIPEDGSEPYEERVIRIGRADGGACDMDASILHMAINQTCKDAGYDREGGPIRIEIQSEVNLYGDASYLFSPKRDYESRGRQGPSYTFDDSLTKLNTENVTNMRRMFAGCADAKHINTSNFNTSNATDLSEMFAGCTSLESADVSSFDTSNAIYLSEMFADCESLQSIDISHFRTDSARYVARMFSNCKSVKTIDVSMFDLRDEYRDVIHDYVYDMLDGYPGTAKKRYPGIDKGYDDPDDAVSIETRTTAPQDGSEPHEELVVRIGNPDGRPCELDAQGLRDALQNARDAMDGVHDRRTMRVELSGPVRLHGSAAELFHTIGASYTFDDSLKLLDLSDVNNVSRMFKGCDKATHIDISGADTRNVTDASQMFEGCTSLKSVDVSGLDFSNVTDVSQMFAGCTSMESVDMSSLDFSNVTDISDMFRNCKALKDVNTSNLNLPNVTDAHHVFYGCESLERLDFTNARLPSLRSADSMMCNCSNLKWIGVSGLEAPNLSSADYMLYDCTSLETIDGLSPELSKTLGKIIQAERQAGKTEFWDGCYNLHHLTGIRLGTRDNQIVEAEISSVKDRSGRYDRTENLKQVVATITAPPSRVAVTWDGVSAITDTNVINRSRNVAVEIERRAARHDDRGAALRNATAVLAANAEETCASQEKPAKTVPETTAPKAPTYDANPRPRHDTGDFGD